MISDLIVFFNSYQGVVTFLTHLIVFIGVFYIALHNRNLPQWHITPLWYLGLFCLLTCMTILVQFFIGPEHPLSYWNLGQLAESSVDIVLASIVLVMFLVTLKNDVDGSRNRRQTK